MHDSVQFYLLAGLFIFYTIIKHTSDKQETQGYFKYIVFCKDRYPSNFGHQGIAVIKVLFVKNNFEVALQTRNEFEIFF